MGTVSSFAKKKKGKQMLSFLFHHYSVLQKRPWRQDFQGYARNNHHHSLLLRRFLTLSIALMKEGASGDTHAPNFTIQGAATSSHYSGSIHLPDCHKIFGSQFCHSKSPILDSSLTQFIHSNPHRTTEDYDMPLETIKKCYLICPFYNTHLF